MIYIGIADVTALSGELESMAVLPEFLKERAANTRNEKERKLRTGAYLLLCRMYDENKMHSGELSGVGAYPKVVLDENGRPCFENENGEGVPSFNISHSETLAAVCLSDEAMPVGIDIQAEPKAAVLERIAARFFAPFKGETQTRACEGDARSECAAEAELKTDEEYGAFYIDGGSEKDKIKLSAYKFAPNGELARTEIKSVLDSIEFVCDGEARADNLSRWTVLEAALKMNGGGFADFGESERILGAASTYTVQFKHTGKRYSLTLATATDEA